MPGSEERGGMVGGWRWGWGRGRAGAGVQGRGRAGVGLGRVLSPETLVPAVGSPQT